MSDGRRPEPSRATDPPPTGGGARAGPPPDRPGHAAPRARATARPYPRWAAAERAGAV